MIKLVASDLDGTLLLGAADELNPEIYDIVLKLKELGIPFISASGRPLASQRALWKPIVNDILYIAENGGICVCDNQTFVVVSFEDELAHRILDQVQLEPECQILVSCPQHCYIVEGDEAFLNYIHDFLKMDVVVLKDFREIPEPIIKIAYHDAKAWQESSQYLRSIFGNEVVVVTSGNCWVDFMPSNSNKGAALKFILEKFGISPEDVVAFGDQPNDVEMISYVGHSYAMEQGAPETKACAKHVTNSVEKTLREIIKTLEN